MLAPKLASAYLLSMTDSISDTGAGLCIENYGQMLYGDFFRKRSSARPDSDSGTETVKTGCTEASVSAKNANYDAALYAEVLLDTPGLQQRI